MGKSKSEDKPFQISKREVWEAYQKVKANQGAPGVDGCSIEDFEKDLRSNLFKLWNRMSSGSYFPPPVKAVPIPKDGVVGFGSWVCRRSGTGLRRPWWPGGWSTGGENLPC